MMLAMHASIGHGIRNMPRGQVAPPTDVLVGNAVRMYQSKLMRPSQSKDNFRSGLEDSEFTQPSTRD